MAVKARGTITLQAVVDVAAVYRYYLLQSSTSAAPSKPTTNPPGGNWSLAEPGYTSGATNSLYTVDLTVFSDGTFSYSNVCLSSSYEAAKEAYNQSVAAGTAASNAAAVAEEAHSLSVSVDEAVGELEVTMSETYLAKAAIDPTIAAQFGLTYDDSDPDNVVYYDNVTGTAYTSILSKIEADARTITESYQYVSSTTLQANIDDLNAAIQTTEDLINGQIKRGFIDLGNDNYVFGIVVSSRNVFSASQNHRTPEGETSLYWEIDTDQCFGLYTATGWQFWVGDRKLGWFDTTDGVLHVADISIENNLIMGDWILTQNSTIWGLKYIGA